MIPIIDHLEAFIRGLLSPGRRRWRRACLAVVRHRRWSERMGLAVLEQSERAIARRDQQGVTPRGGYPPAA